MPRGRSGKIEQGRDVTGQMNQIDVHLVVQGMERADCCGGRQGWRVLERLCVRYGEICTRSVRDRFQ